MAEVHGICDPAFSAVQQTLKQHIETGREVGASVCVIVKGKTVVDIWAGHADAAKTKPWQEDTITPVWSLTKNVMILAMLMLIDRGQLDPDAPVARYWPEFGVNGKEGILVRHVMSHTAGLPSFDPAIDEETLYTTPLSTQNLVEQKPWWTPGTARGYHSVSQGHLVEGIVRRVTGKSLGEFIHEEIAVPRNADFNLPTEEAAWPRIAELIPTDVPDFSFLDRTSLPYRALTGSPPNPLAATTATYRKSGNGANTGITNARALSRILSIITSKGTVDGRRYLSAETVEKIFDVQATGPDVVLGLDGTWGMGYALAIPALEWVPTGKVAFWTGWGGSFSVMDVEREVTFSYIMNKMTADVCGSEQAKDHLLATYEALKTYTAQ
ncbi:beta-lactamase/transpeptidase-like protein [Aspergillus avenaceus]|uniref:Beta-lactamase/transpeptidase-like protein n=1 Tax=Aspergillus avenaceus TaxID=36643 RepID=A0A5N6U194_ASPAV|nr:beta-lactamase/transpeptidase-like protein [Aspergillus avenaceus]